MAAVLVCTEAGAEKPHQNLTAFLVEKPVGYGDVLPGSAALGYDGKWVGRTGSPDWGRGCTAWRLAAWVWPRVATMNDRVRSVEVSGFTSIGHAVLELRDLNILIGANGAGKSNFIRALGLLSDLVNDRLGLHVAEAGGASVLLNKNLPAEEIGLVLEVPPRRYEVRLVPSAHDRLFFAEELLGLRLGEGWRVAAGFPW